MKRPLLFLAGLFIAASVVFAAVPGAPLIFLDCRPNTEGCGSPPPPPPLDCGESVLCTAAEALSAGQWSSTLSMTGMLDCFKGKGASGHIASFTTEGVYDPVHKKIEFIGGDHGDGLRHCEYDEATSAWSPKATLPEVPTILTNASLSIGATDIPTATDPVLAGFPADGQSLSIGWPDGSWQVINYTTASCTPACGFHGLTRFGAPATIDHAWPSGTEVTRAYSAIHTWDGLAIDPKTGKMYWRMNYGGTFPHWLNEYTIASSTWTKLCAVPPGGDFLAPQNTGVTWVPSLGPMVWNGNSGSGPSTPSKVYRLQPDTCTWSTFASGTWAADSAQSNTLLYSETHDRMVLLGRDGGNGVALVDRDAVHTTLADAPSGVNTNNHNSGGASGAIVASIDPVSGNLITLATDQGSPASRKLYRTDLTTGTWTDITSTSPPPSSLWSSTNGSILNGVFAVPIPAYGVIFYGSCHGSSFCDGYLFKPSNTTGWLDYYARALGTWRTNGLDSALFTKFHTSGPVAGFDVFDHESGRYTLDTTTKASGPASLKYSIPAVLGEASDYFAMNFSPFTKNDGGSAAYPNQVDTGQTVYIQFRMRMDAAFIANTYRDTGGFVTGPKVIIVNAGDRPGVQRLSCEDQEQTITLGRTDVDIPTAYHVCGVTGIGYFPAAEPVGGDFYMQNGIRGALGVGCRFAGFTAPPCFAFVANEWATIQVKMTIGTRYHDLKTGSPTVTVVGSTAVFSVSQGSLPQHSRISADGLGNCFVDSGSGTTFTVSNTTGGNCTAVVVATVFHVFSPYKHDGIYTVWMAHEGQAPVKIISFDPADDTGGACHAAHLREGLGTNLPPCQTGWDYYVPDLSGTWPYGKLWITPFMTGKDPAQSPAPAPATIWVDEVLVSDSCLKFPLQASCPL